MTINLYKIAKDNRVVDKITGAVALNNNPITIKPTDKISLLQPVFEIDIEAAYMTPNYLYCDTFDSYYYITDVRVNTAQRLELECMIDVRQTFSAALLSSEATVIRNEKLLYPTQIQDSKLPVNPSRKIITSIVIPEVNRSFDTAASYSYLLTVVGGEPNINKKAGELNAALS